MERDIEQYFRSNRTKFFLLAFLSIIIFSIGLLFIISTNYISELLLINYRTVIITGALLFIFGLGMFLLVYLNTRPLYMNSRRLSEYDDLEMNSIFNRNLKKNLVEKYGKGYEEWREDKKSSKQKLFENDLIVFKEKFIEQSLHDLEFANLFEELYKLENKLRSQIERLISNSNLNLVIGIITSSIAIIYLGISVFNHDLKTSIELISYFVPRISTVIFVEIFSFFFLKLYKSNLAEIKYFQNEISNLNFKITALKTAIKMKDNTTISELVKTFSLTERNFILKKDESTEKIEIQKIDSTNSTNLLQNFSSIIKSIKG